MRIVMSFGSTNGCDNTQRAGDRNTVSLSACVIVLALH